MAGSTDAGPSASYQRSIFLIKVQLVIIALLIFVVVCESVVIVSLFPLKSTELVVYEFKDNSKNFVKVHAANQPLQANDVLLQLFMEEYVINRETVDRVSESLRYRRVMAMNTSDENARFKANYGGPNAPINQKGFNRDIEIKRSTRLAKNFYQVEFSTRDWWDAQEGPKKQPEVNNEWVATFEFKFEPQVVSMAEATFNPLGIFVSRYALSKRN